VLKRIAYRFGALTVAAVLAGACASQPAHEPSQIALATPPAIVAPVVVAEVAKPVPPRPARAALASPTKIAVPTAEAIKPGPPVRTTERPAPAAPPVTAPTAPAAEQPIPEPQKRTAEAPVVIPPPVVVAPTPEPPKPPVRTRTAEQPGNDNADPEKAKRFALKETAVVAAVIAASRAAYLGMGKPCACPDNVTPKGHACGLRSAHSRPGGYRPLCYPTDVSALVINHWRATGAIPPI
jgi:hypothetical protein